jgi:hypothetical protein
VLIKFFQRCDGNVDIVFLEAEQAGWIVHQHVGIEYEKFGNGGF